MQLQQIKSIFQRCFADAAIFAPSEDGTFVEMEIVNKENKNWLVVAAGIDRGCADDYFATNRSRAERAVRPVQLIPSGELSLLYVVRPIDRLQEDVYPLDPVVGFSPGDRIPWIILRDQCFVRLWDLPDENSRVQSLRWELDIRNARLEPHEAWLRNWKHQLQFNAAHPPSHMHINAPSFHPDEAIDDRDNHDPDELRLAVGVPNPLSLILSLASWLRRVPRE